MSKFNKTIPKRVPTTINEMGEKAYQLSAKEELVSTCLTTFLQSSYYESENEIVERIKKAIESADDKVKDQIKEIEEQIKERETNISFEMFVSTNNLEF